MAITIAPSLTFLPKVSSISGCILRDNADTFIKFSVIASLRKGERLIISSVTLPTVLMVLNIFQCVKINKKKHLSVRKMFLELISIIFLISNQLVSRIVLWIVNKLTVCYSFIFFEYINGVSHRASILDRKSTRLNSSHVRIS